VSEFCPVCKNAINEKTTKCNVCGFDDLHREFITKEDGELWNKEVVEPYRKQWENSKKTVLNDDFDAEVYSRTGYDKDGYDRSGRNAWGYDRDGYDKRGFDKKGYNKLGNHKSEFDAEGYHKLTGYNVEGYNRKGYDVNGKRKPHWFRDKFKNLGKKQDYSCPADDFEIVDRTIVKYNGSSSVVIIPDGIADKIGNSAFRDNNTINEVIISDEIKSIGESAFQNCSMLTKVYIPNEIKEIESYTFSKCTSLSSINIPESITTIDDFAFYGCPLSKIEFPKGLKIIGDSAFSNNEVIQDLYIPSSVIEIGQYAFDSCSNLVNIDIPDSVQKINCGFGGSKLYKNFEKNIYSTNDVSMFYIGNHLIDAVRKTDSSQVLCIKEGTKTIQATFGESFALFHIQIPKSVTYIKKDAFGYTSSYGSKFYPQISCYRNSYAHRYLIENNIPIERFFNDNLEVLQ